MYIYVTSGINAYRVYHISLYVRGCDRRDMYGSFHDIICLDWINSLASEAPAI